MVLTAEWNAAKRDRWAVAGVSHRTGQAADAANLVFVHGLDLYRRLVYLSSMRFRDQRQNNGTHVPAGPVPEWDFRTERVTRIGPNLEVEAYVANLRAQGEKRTVHVEPDQLDIIVEDILFILKPSQLTDTAEVCPVHRAEVMRYPLKDAKAKFFAAREKAKQSDAPAD